jgi:protein-S-isoprenylcysteine O-methyltransferase Ste14
MDVGAGCRRSDVKGRTMKANLITLVAFVVATVWLVLHLHLIAWTPVKIAGATLAAGAIAMLVVARLQLGASFSVKAKARKLVTTGLYAKIRNPIYVFGGLFLVGIAIVLENWILLLILAVLAPVQIARSKKEEQVLHDAFGEEYERYKAGTWF